MLPITREHLRVQAVDADQAGFCMGHSKNRAGVGNPSGNQFAAALYDLHAVFILKGDAGNLIKGNTVPHTDKADGFRGHVVEKIRHRGLSTVHENAVWRNLFIA